MNSISFPELHKYLLNLELLRDDQELFNQGWKIHFAVDSYNLYQYAFPFNNFIDSEEFSDEQIKENSLQQAAISFIFEKRSKSEIPLILPSHNEELNDIILNYQMDLLSFSSTKEGKILEKIQIDESDLQNIMKTMANYSVSSEMDAIEEKLHNEIIFKKFYNLLFFLSGYANRGIEKINTLLANPEKGITTFTQKWPQYLEEYLQFYRQDFTESKWYEILSTHRTDPFKKKANLQDAKAIETILWLNQKFKEDNKKEIILLVSDATTMFNVLNNDLTDKKSDHSTIGKIELDNHIIKSTRILRDSNIFLLFLAFNNLSKSNLIKKLNEKINDYYDMLIYKATVININSCPLFNTETVVDLIGLKCSYCVKCERRKDCTILRGYDDIKKDYNNFIKSGMYLNRNSYIQSFIPKIKDSINKKEELSKTIYDFIKRKNNKLEEIYQVESKKIFSNLFNIHLFEEYLSNDTKHKTQFIKNKIKEILSEPYKISFESEEFLNEIYEIIKDNEYEGAKLINRFVEIIGNTTDNKLDSIILLSIIYFSIEVFNYSIQILKRALQNVDEEKSQNVLYLLALIYEKASDKNLNDQYLLKSLNIINELLEINPDEPKYYHLKGRILYSLRKIFKQTQNEDPYEVFDKGLNIAISTRKDNNILLATFYNNLAYLQLENEDIVDKLGKVEDYIDFIQTLLPEKNMSASIFDTISNYHLLKYQFIDSVDEKFEQYNLSFNYHKKSLAKLKKTKSFSWVPSDISTLSKDLLLAGIDLLTIVESKEKRMIIHDYMKYISAEFQN